MMNEQVKKFIENNIDLIEQNKWEEIYKRCEQNLSQKHIGLFTKSLLDCGINPLDLGLDYIPNYFLNETPNITEFIIPKNIKSIGIWAFNHCDLKKINIPDNVTYIATGAFGFCKSLISINISDNVVYIGNDAFTNCDSLTEIIIPNSVTNIGDELFYQCNSLKEIKYLGTKKEALTKLKIKQRKRWKFGSSINKIICTDGVIEL